jgi:hypothetical protein
VDPDISDGELLAASSSRPDAFAAFYDRYETAVVGYFTRRTGDPEVAADLTATRAGILHGTVSLLQAVGAGGIEGPGSVSMPVGSFAVRVP